MTFRLKSPELSEAQVSAAFFRLLAAQPWAVHVQIPRARIPRKASSAVRRAAERARVDWYAQIVDRLRDRPACLAFWRSNTGAGQIGTGGRFVEFGLWGQPDIEGVFSPLGLRVGIELKRKSTYLSPQQKVHQDLLLTSGAIYIVVRDPRSGVDDLKSALSKRLESPLD